MPAVGDERQSVATARTEIRLAEEAAEGSEVEIVNGGSETGRLWSEIASLPTNRQKGLKFDNTPNADVLAIIDGGMAAARPGSHEPSIDQRDVQPPELIRTSEPAVSQEAFANVAPGAGDITLPLVPLARETDEYQARIDRLRQILDAATERSQWIEVDPTGAYRPRFLPLIQQANAVLDQEAMAAFERRGGAAITGLHVPAMIRAIGLKASVEFSRDLSDADLSAPGTDAIREITHRMAELDWLRS